MVQGRGSAAQGLAVGLLLLCLLFSTDITEAATYKVDWSFSANSWTNGKTFRRGDVLVFKYNRSDHNVVEVDASGYYGCRSSGARLYSSGSDTVTLGKQTTYFICSLPGHCEAGMKMTVTAN